MLTITCYSEKHLTGNEQHITIFKTKYVIIIGTIGKITHALTLYSYIIMYNVSVYYYSHWDSSATLSYYLSHLYILKIFIDTYVYYVLYFIIDITYTIFLMINKPLS